MMAMREMHHLEQLDEEELEQLLRVGCFGAVRMLALQIVSIGLQQKDSLCMMRRRC